MAVDLFEYNLYSSVIEFLQENIDDTLIGQNIDVYPSYPKVTGFKNPSIILQKIVSKSESISLGNDLGQQLIGDTYYDVKGMLWGVIYQIDIITDGNINKLKIASFITDLLIKTKLGHDPYVINRKEIILKDFFNNKTDIGRIQVVSDIDSNDLQLDPNDDYRTVLRVELEVIQTIIPEYEIIDFSKPIKWTQTINV